MISIGFDLITLLEQQRFWHISNIELAQCKSIIVHMYFALKQNQEVFSFEILHHLVLCFEKHIRREAKYFGCMKHTLVVLLIAYVLRNIINFRYFVQMRLGFFLMICKLEKQVYSLCVCIETFHAR